ncbi:hypothetical protein FIBSPDRAFT_314830 [Athelia psychrophila]|uniref:Uncharacterized protein n=1 Tax=Athelia psychrophila TaxID=1759441 RepID=A0A166QN04_9AGAM|nr:hypothetical protein FIBSPDRAFT_314830 [Fibularhizoctonia sp. CBS 109695]
MPPPRSGNLYKSFLSIPHRYILALLAASPRLPALNTVQLASAFPRLPSLMTPAHLLATLSDPLAHVRVYTRQKFGRYDPPYLCHRLSLSSVPPGIHPLCRIFDSIEAVLNAPSQERASDLLSIWAHEAELNGGIEAPTVRARQTPCTVAKGHISFMIAACGHRRWIWTYTPESSQTI